MSLAIPQVHVGDAIRCESLTIFPLFVEPNGDVEYLLSNEAISSETISVEEVSQGGSVPELLVENKGESRVLFLEGEELIGAKQNRVLNTSVLAPAKCKLKIPVSCVEQGRWSYKSRKFAPSNAHSPSALRHKLKASVTRSLKAKRGHRSDQGQVWEEVSRQQESMGVVSESTAMFDTFTALSDRLEEFRRKLAYVEGCSGMAVAVGSKIATIDLFDKPATCQRVWDRLATGTMIDALETKEAATPPTSEEVEALLRQVYDAPWERVQAVGDGEEYRVELGATQASALFCESSPVHLSVVAER